MGTRSLPVRSLPHAGLHYFREPSIQPSPGMDQIVLPIKLPSSNKINNCGLFGIDIKGKDCGAEVVQWFTNYLKT